MTLQPFLFIGVGGTGGKTLGVIQDQLRTELAAIGRSELPPGWQFLHIDVPAVVDTAATDLPYGLSRTEYVPLTTESSTFSNVSQSVDRSLGSDGYARYQAWDCWRPYPPDRVKVTLSEGAGQYRGVGRVASLHGLKTVADAVRGALDEFRGAAAANQFQQIQRDRGLAADGIGKQEPMVFIIGSIAGGSGSGMLLDVAEVVRSLGQQNVSAIVFTPEVFENTIKKGPRFEPGVAPNTYAAVCELANAMWTVKNQGASSRDALFHRAGLTRAGGFGGPAAVFLVGKSSSGLTLESADAVYSVVGHSLAAVALGADLANDLSAYVKTNLNARATGMNDLLGLSPTRSRDLGLFNALGFGRLALGRDHLARYSTDRLLRRAVTRLLERHLAARRPGDGKTPDDLLNEAVEEALDGFIDDIGLDETGPGNDDVLNAISPMEAMEKDFDTFRQTVASEIGKLDDGKWIKSAEARAEAVQRVRQEQIERDGIPNTAQEWFKKSVASWSRASAEQVRTTVITAVAEYGFPVTIRLLDELIAHSVRGVAELRGPDHAKASAKYSSQIHVLGAGLAGEAQRFRSSDTAFVQRIADQAKQTLRSSVYVQTLSDTADVFEDLIENLLKPWRNALLNAEELLRARCAKVNGASPLDRLPGDQGVPKYLQPSPVEMLLDDWEQFPEVMVEKVAHSAGDDIDVSDGQNYLGALDVALKQMIRGIRLPRNEQNPLSAVTVYTQTWIPKTIGGVQRTEARIDTKFDLPHLEARIAAWLHDDRKEVGLYLHESIPEYLEGRGQALPQATAIRRADHVVNQFSAALKSSAPLVALDAKMVLDIHQQTDPTVWSLISRLPIPSHLTAVRSRINDVALDWGASVSFTDEPRDEVTILTAFNTPYHAVEVTSIMEPVSSQWLALSGNPDFWKDRRTAPLPDWVPLSPMAQDCLLKGWFAARILGRAAYEDGSHHVYLPPIGPGHQGQWAKVGRGIRLSTHEDQVGALLGALPIALIDSFTHRSLEPLAPFQTLIQLGSELGRSNSDAVMKWVNTGEGVVDSERQYEDLTGVDSAEERQKALSELLEELIENFRSLSKPEAFVDPGQAQAYTRHEVLEETLDALSALKSSAVAQRTKKITL